MSAQMYALDVEVHADRHAEMLEELEAEQNQALLDPTAAPDGPGSLEDAAEFDAFNRWADQAVQTLPDWPAIRGAA